MQRFESDAEAHRTIPHTALTLLRPERLLALRPGWNFSIDR
jgi:hypothetical protein